jgi:transcriptional regulator with PAS, ATPase and Fis domain
LTGGLLTKQDWNSSLSKWVDSTTPPEGMSFFDMRDCFERFIVADALERHGTNTKAAIALGIERTTLVEIKKRLASR